MKIAQPTLLASDLEGVLIPEIWVAVAEKTGIEQLFLTTRDIANYDELMGLRLRALIEHHITLADVHAVIATVEPLPGAVELVQWIRSQTQLIVITDSFYEFLVPLLPKLGYPTVFAHSLQSDDKGMLTGYKLRQPHSKRKAVHALKEIGFRVMAFGERKLRKAFTSSRYTPPIAPRTTPAVPISPTMRRLPNGMAST